MARCSSSWFSDTPSKLLRPFLTPASRVLDREDFFRNPMAALPRIEAGHCRHFGQHLGVAPGVCCRANLARALLRNGVTHLDGEISAPRESCESRLVLCVEIGGPRSPSGRDG